MPDKTGIGSVIMYDNIAGGLDNKLNNCSLKNDDLIQVRNVLRLMKVEDATDGDDAKQKRNKYARFYLNLDIDEDSTVSLRDSQYVMKNDKCWRMTSLITFSFIEHPDNRDYQNRRITLYDEYSYNML